MGITVTFKEASIQCIAWQGPGTVLLLTWIYGWRAKKWVPYFFKLQTPDSLDRITDPLFHGSSFADIADKYDPNSTVVPVYYPLVDTGYPL